MSILRFRRPADQPPQQSKLPQGQKLIIYLNGKPFAEHEVIFQIGSDGRLCWGLMVGDDKNWIMGDSATLTLLYGIEFEIHRVPE